jgi:hypothetical protein
LETLEQALLAVPGRNDDRNLCGGRQP